MFNMFDDIGSLARRAAAFITGRGATMTAVATAAAVMPGASATPLVLVGLGVGLPITAAMSTMAHHSNETRILNNFRAELAETFGVDPKDVTHDHLRLLAFGDESIGLEPQSFFKEALERNDKSRWIDMGANALGALGTMAFVAARGTSLLAMATTAGVAPALATAGLFAAAAVMVMSMDKVFGMIGKSLFEDKERTTHDHLETMALNHGRGRSISQEAVMGVIATVNPSIQEYIALEFSTSNKKGEVSYYDLPLATKTHLTQRYSEEFDIPALTSKINSGAINLSELPFIAEDPSWIPIEQSVDINPEAHKKPTLRQKLSHAKEHLHEMAEDHRITDNVLRSNDKKPTPDAELPATHEPSKSHVERLGYASDRQPVKAGNFAAQFADMQAQQAATHAQRVEAKSPVSDEVVTLH